MTEIETFFSAWSMADAEDRAATIKTAVSDDITYADPRTETPLSGPEALADYVGMFSAAAPGATATVVKQDETQGTARVTVAFRMADGMEQHGQYFVEPGHGRIARMTGFVGMGVPE